MDYPVWLKWLGNAASPVGALREQVSLLKAQLAEAHSLIDRQMAQIRDLEADNKQLKTENEELKKAAQEKFLKPIQPNTKWIV